MLKIDFNYEILYEGLEIRVLYNQFCNQKKQLRRLANIIRSNMEIKMNST
jgi:hypothetical protein